MGNVIHCTDGYLVFLDGYCQSIAYDLKGEVLRRFGTPKENVFQQHIDNFIAAVRSRRRADQHADIEEGHISSALCHLGNISYRLGRPTPFNGSTSAFGDDKEAGETFQRMQEHLRDNTIPLDKTSYLLGRRLTVDAKTERFSGDDEANRYLTRRYRKGFEVPARA